MRQTSRKSDPFSIRLRADDDRFVKDEARRLQRPRGAIVEAYASEAISMRRFPGIAFRGDDHRRRAWVLGTGLDVWELVAILRDFGSEEEVAREYEITPGQIRIALAYYRDHEDEIDALIERGRRSREDARVRYPFVTPFPEGTGGSGP